MKELTLEEKARAYDEAKARMSKAYNSNRCTIGFMNEIFPELKESDEKIKEEIINYFKCQSRDEPCRKSIHDKWIAWIEKQSQTFTKEDVDDAYLKGISDTKKKLEKQGKSALEAIKEEKVDDINKFKPRFEVGKWIVLQGKCYKVYNNGCGYELLDQDGFITSLEYGTVDETAHFWDITKDAKDGDVLVDAYGNIGIYKSHDEFTWKSYCSLGCNRGFKGFEVEHENDKTYPATKEQLDILMKEWLPQDILLILKSKYKM